MPSFTIYDMPLFLAAIVSIALGFYSWRLRQFKGIIPFCLVVFLCGTWAMSAGIDTLTAGLGLKVFLLQVRMTAAALVPVCWLTMTVTLVGKRHAMKPYWVGLLLIPPVIILGLTWTMGGH